LGYLNDYRTKRVIVDRERAPLVKEAFARYATGEVTLDDLRHYFAGQNVHTRNGKMLTRGNITKTLSNPFYYGHFRYAGDVYEGTHEPLISKQLFDQAQAVLKSRYKWSPNHTPVKPKPFLGLLHCSTCGGAITAEVQKGHTYYRCTKKSRATTWCLQPYIREEDLNIEISDLLKPYSLSADWADDMLTRVNDEKKQTAQSARLMADQKRKEIEKINLRLQTLLDSFLDGIIDREAYVAEKAKGMSQKKSLEEQSSALLKGRAYWLEPLQNWILTARNAGEIAVKGSLQEKRVLAQQVFRLEPCPRLQKPARLAARGSCVKFKNRGRVPTRSKNMMNNWYQRIGF
jgi:site-specific DNA recombinase